MSTAYQAPIIYYDDNCPKEDLERVNGDWTCATTRGDVIQSSAKAGNKKKQPPHPKRLDLTRYKGQVRGEITTWIKSLWGEGPEGSAIYVLVSHADHPQEPVEIWNLRFGVWDSHPVVHHKLEDFGVCGPSKWAIERLKRRGLGRPSNSNRAFTVFGKISLGRPLPSSSS